jgi:hypothetical protein
MPEASPREEMNVRVIREGCAEPEDEDWISSSPEERIEAVWTLTKLCIKWNDRLADEPRLQRTVTHIQRSER